MKSERKLVQWQVCMTTMTGYQLYPGESCSYGEASFQCIVIVTQGSVKCSSIDDLVLMKGDSVFLSCNHSIRLFSGEKESHIYILEFQATAFTKESIQPLYGQVIRLKLFHKQVLRMNQLFSSLNDSSIAIQMANYTFFQELFMFLYGAYTNEAYAEDTILNVKRTIAYIQHYYHTKLTIEKLANQANISPRQYLRIFKKITSKTPTDYIQHYRIYRAQEQLLQTTKPVHKIAIEVGIEDVHYFNRVFKQLVGCTPKEYVRLRHEHSKVVTIHYIGELLALGMKPLGDLGESIDQIPKDRTSFQKIGESTCDLALLKNLHPDILIISDAVPEEVRVKIEEFVPVIVIPWDTNPAERLMRIAKVLGKLKEASSLLAKYEQARKITKKKYATIPKQTAVILRLDHQKVWVHATRFFPTFYEVLPFIPTKFMEQTTELHPNLRRVEVPYDYIEQVEADCIYIVVDEEQEYKHFLRELQALPKWKQLSAVEKGQVYLLRKRGIFNNLTTLQWQLEEVSSIISGQPNETGDGLMIGKLTDLVI